ncbi:enoyl-CoA hydratase/isomerase family protein [Sneathiella sp. CAU 1612]|uniref:Enoyl-CoA hydratase/isomerase family protein n=1 Tax=Sneathiella sedimenti TaxID=2816034 RepID=A0ABS3F3Q7_9PROT|nr:enoyl-CoA hydratase-related protein [Sneathiella sedimenti]MBO0333157.1 enoyl-CoA hydratase/isomerase family protein [Sneathiella sedimenti]
MENFKNIIFEVDNSVATLTLNRPEALNAMTFELMYEIQDALKIIDEDKSIRALILTGSGRGFCAGQDLRNRPPEGSDIVELYTGCYFDAINAIRICRVPVITAVNGAAAGGGFSLALAGDILIAGKSAKFIQVFSRIGLSPDLGSTYLLPQAIGRARALRMMMTNEPVSADQAFDWGLVSDVYDDDKLMDEARALAAKLASGPTYALEMTRKTVDESAHNDFKTQFRRELEVNAELREKYDSKEGVAAFLEKRPAVFKGE